MKILRQGLIPGYLVCNGCVCDTGKKPEPSKKHLFNSSLMGLQDLAFGRAIITFWTGPADQPKVSVLMFLPL